jgi:hypothetical protein
MSEEKQQFVITRHFVVENTSLEAAEKELNEFIVEKLQAQQSEPIDAEFREIGKGE